MTIEEFHMQRSGLTLIFTVLIGVACGIAAPSMAVETHDHQHEATAPSKLQLNQGKKWGTDAPLRQGMTAMRADLASKLHAIHQGNLTKEGYAALGKSIEAQISMIVSQCKLDPKADAMLHIVISDLAGSAEIMQGKAAGQPAEAAHRAVLALNSYSQYFSHPGWKPIK
jgi:hypothetical protein